MNFRSTLGKMAAVGAVCSLFISVAQADVRPDPGDYTGLPAGTDLLVGYLQMPRADDVYANGKKVVSNLDLKVNAGILRYVHYTKLGGYIIDPQIIVPFGQQKVGLSDTKTSGLGDVIFGATLWTIADLQRGEHLGWSLFLTAPTGSDKSKGFALSNDRWATDIQGGYIRKLSEKWTVDIVGEAEFYQDTRETKVKTDPLLQAYAHLSYSLNEASRVSLSYRHASGAKATLAGATVSDKKNNDTMMVGWASFLTKQFQLQLQYTDDVHVEEGPKLRGLQARVVYAY